MHDSCDACLRRAFLIAHLAPRIAGLLGGHRRVGGLLGLPDDDLIAAAAGRHVERALAFVDAIPACSATCRIRRRCCSEPAARRCSSCSERSRR
jgi:hypothetical protein